jgi:hypothetical protein
MNFLKVETVIASITANLTGGAVILVIMYVEILNIFVDQGQFSDPDFISGTHQREISNLQNNI